MGKIARVCHIVSTFNPDIGGIQRATESLCKELVNRGIDVIVLTRRYPGLSKFEKIAGVPVYRLGYPSWSRVGALSFALHTLWILAIRFRGYRIIHVQNLDIPLLIGFLCKAFLGRYLVVTIHGEMRILTRQQSRLGRARLKLMRLLTDMFGAISQPTQIQLTEEGIPRSRIRQIPNGIDMAIFRPPTTREKLEARARLGLDDSEVVALYLGRLVSLKRLDLLLQAWPRPSTGRPRKLLVVGDGPERQVLERLASDLCPAGVRFEGATDDVLSYFHAADVFVLPSQQEGLSVALLEAMATGLTVVVTALPGNQDLVRHGENGLMVPVDDLEALIDQLDLSLQSSALRQQLGQNAHRSICKAYSLQAVAEMHQRLYEAILT